MQTYDVVRTDLYFEIDLNTYLDLDLFAAFHLFFIIAQACMNARFCFACFISAKCQQENEI